MEEDLVDEVLAAPKEWQRGRERGGDEVKKQERKKNSECESCGRLLLWFW